MKSLKLFLFMVACYKSINAQGIKIIPLKKVYQIKNEKVYCRVSNLSAYTVYYRVGFEVSKNGKLIGETDDVYNLLPTKTTKETRFTILKPIQAADTRRRFDTIGKESLYGIFGIIHSENYEDYDYRFKVIYGTDTNAVNKIMYSTLFKIISRR